MNDKKTKQVWRVDCMMCETTVNLDVTVDGFRIISTDQGAEFLIKPYIICGKCQSVCVVKLAEVEDETT